MKNTRMACKEEHTHTRLFVRIQVSVWGKHEQKAKHHKTLFYFLSIHLYKWASVEIMSLNSEQGS